MNLAPSSPIERALGTIAHHLAQFAAQVASGQEIALAFEASRRREFGDFATNISFSLAKAARSAPQRIAEQLVEQARQDPALQPLLAEINAIAGFINLRLAPSVWHELLAQVLHEGEHFGRNSLVGSASVSLEFGSANPTGPLVVVQGRTLSVGSTIANALRFCGVQVTTEWIINDAGNQLETFGRSIYARYRQLTDLTYPFPEDGYPGDYVAPIAQALQQRDGDRWNEASEAEWLPVFARFGRDSMVTDQQHICERFGVAYDLWQSELALHQAGAVDRGLQRLSEAGLTYEQDGALWFAATRFADDKDRVVRRADGRPTYYAGDVAYHHDKYERGAACLIDILGPDHHGYIGRLKALAAALGHPDTLEVLIVQQMTLVRGSEVVSLSKRSGNVLTLEEVIDEVGVDAARFFFILSSTDSPLTFDLELAKRTSEDNPVYYVQYGHARIASLLKRAPAELLQNAREAPHLHRLASTSELTLIGRIAEFTQVVTATATARAPHRLARYARELAGDFHQVYAEHRIMSDDAELSSARLALALATQQILATVLRLVGVTAPQSM